MVGTGVSSFKRVFVEKKTGFAIEARRVQEELAGFLGSRYPALACLAGIKILHRYDAAGLDEEQVHRAVDLVFSEPQCDLVFFGAVPPAAETDADIRFFGVEYLPGQYDQRADSAEQCIELALGVKPGIRTAKIYGPITGDIPLTDAAVEAVKRYLINSQGQRI